MGQRLVNPADAISVEARRVVGRRAGPDRRAAHKGCLVIAFRIAPSRAFVHGLAAAWLVAGVAGAQSAPTPLPKPVEIAAAPADTPIARSAPAPAEAPPPAAPEADAPPRERPETRIGDSGLPVPRFVTLKSGEVFMREGPSPQHRVEWVYRRRGLPMEVIAEYDVWRRVRDADGVVGWVHKGMTEGRRNVIVTGKGDAPLLDAPDASGHVVAYAQPGVIASLKSCGGAFCEVEAQSISAYVARANIWGVYADESVE